MVENPIHHLSVRVSTWQKDTPNEFRVWEENYRGTGPEQCDQVAAGHGVTEKIDDRPAHEKVPYHDRQYLRDNDGEMTLVWCRATPIRDGNSSMYRILMPSVDDVFPKDYTPVEIDALVESLAPDAHLEAAYDDRFSAWDDEPSPYFGDSSEE